MAAPSQLVGYTLGHYRILQQIGSGAMGLVYQAWDTRLDRYVAIKLISPGVLLEEGARKGFRKEALALAKLNHAHIATIYDFDAQDGIDFLAMEYVHGENLASKLRSGPLSEKQIVMIGEQIADALSCAHASDMVHRDLKPANIMISSNGQVKLLDFGLSVLLHSSRASPELETVTAVHSVAGTLALHGSRATSQ